MHSHCVCGFDANVTRVASVQRTVGSFNMSPQRQALAWHSIPNGLYRVKSVLFKLVLCSEICDACRHTCISVVDLQPFKEVLDEAGKLSGPACKLVPSCGSFVVVHIYSIRSRIICCRIFLVFWVTLQAIVVGMMAHFPLLHSFTGKYEGRMNPFSVPGIPYTMSKSGRPALFCRDPDGNALEVSQVGPQHEGSSVKHL